MKRFASRISQIFLLYLFPAWTGTFNASAQTFSVDTILYNGNPNKYINLVFMGDGFQSGQLSSYIAKVNTLSNYLLSISPYAEYKNYFNVFAIMVPSIGSGTDHPGTATDVIEPAFPVANVNTYFNSTFDYYSIHRLLVPQNFSGINTVLINSFPFYDQSLMLVNSVEYGGSGGGTATTSLQASAYDILIHEMGHSFANLADEYYAGDFYAAEKTNMTQQTNPTLVKWKNWIGYGGVGVYQHCCGGNSGLWYKPTNNSCKMEALVNPFCPVCKEAIVEKIHQSFGTTINSYQPNQSTIPFCSQPIKFKVSLIQPISNTLRIKWELNGNNIAMNIDSVTITPGQLNVGNNNLSAQVLDTTALTRDSLHTINHTYTVSWTVNYNPLNNNWTGAVSTAWEDPGNWSCGVIPDANTNVFINSGTVVVNSIGVCGSLTVMSGVNFTIKTGYKLIVTH